MECRTNTVERFHLPAPHQQDSRPLAIMGLSKVVSLLVLSSVAAIDIPTTPTWPSGRCTDKSLTIPSWVIKDYVVKGGVATFQVDNRASASIDCCAFITCSPGEEVCSGSAGSDEMQVTWKKGANGNNVVTVTEFWSCSDEGDKYVIVFHDYGAL